MNRTSTKGSSWQKLRRAFILGAFGTTTLLSAAMGAGCESNVSAYCVTRCDCQGCGEQERADCTDDLEDSQKYADYDGCADKLEAYVTCYTNEGACTNNSWFVTTCATAEAALRECSSRAAKFVKSACEEEQAKREACGLGSSGSSSCSGPSECAAFCALAAPCSDIANWTPGSTYATCTNDCWSGGGP